jgi:hypothetical protein
MMIITDLEAGVPLISPILPSSSLAGMADLCRITLNWRLSTAVRGSRVGDLLTHNGIISSPLRRNLSNRMR